jgi:hypothetical protein
MRVFTAAVAVVCTLLLAIIAWELYPISRVAVGTIEAFTPIHLTTEERRALNKAQVQRFVDDLKASEPYPWPPTPATPSTARPRQDPPTHR